MRHSKSQYNLNQIMFIFYFQPFLREFRGGIAENAEKMTFFRYFEINNFMESFLVFLPEKISDGMNGINH